MDRQFRRFMRKFRSCDPEAQRVSHRAAVFRGSVAIAKMYCSKRNRRNSCTRKRFFLVAAMVLVAAPQFALADGDGTVTGVVGGAVAGAVVGGPVGAVIGGVAGGAIGNAASGPTAPPCGTRTTQTTNTASLR